jgi:hypothetical protein
MSIDIDLTKMHRNNSYDSNYDLNLDLSSVKSMTEQYIIDNPSFERTTDNITNKFYNNFKNTFSTQLTGFDTLETIAVNQINNYNFSPTNTSGEVIITEQDINNYLKMSEVFGNSIIFHRQDGESYKVNYITVDNFYVNLYTNSLGSYADFVVGLNITGYEIMASITCEVSTHNGSELRFDLKNASYRLGDIEIDSALKEKFVDYLASGLSHGDDDTISLSSNRENLIISFNHALQASNAAPFLSHLDVDARVYGDNLNSTNAGVKLNVTYDA